MCSPLTLDCLLLFNSQINWKPAGKAGELCGGGGGGVLRKAAELSGGGQQLQVWDITVLGLPPHLTYHLGLMRGRSERCPSQEGTKTRSGVRKHLPDVVCWVIAGLILS